ncbi:MAG: hypothetical protein M3067_15380 [Chloroflexota bacterium]|nr:hypothetical protein [Chloroflexota bacterium]
MLDRVAVGLVFVAGALLVPPSPFRFLIGIHDWGPLPDHITVCDRDYSKDATNRRWSTADIAADATPGFQPVLVDPGLLARLLSPCQTGACTRVSQEGPCATVIWVRVDWDAYVDYSLQGGP